MNIRDHIFNHISVGEAPHIPLSRSKATEPDEVQLIITNTNLLLQECQAAEPDQVLLVALPELCLSADYY